MGQELDMAETKCLTIKSELSYMMDVCQKGQMEVKERKGTPTVEQIASLFKSPSSKSSVEYYNCKFKFTPANKTPNCNSLRRLHNIEQKAEENSSKPGVLREAACTSKYLYFHRSFHSKPKIYSVVTQKKHRRRRQRRRYGKVRNFEGGNAKRIAECHDYSEESVK
ncbi:uncharacterized protein LOC109503619 [Harpegnathos saltator]|uniref:uncharacterized protein LOC109503619 n=1 Tax=Harpegnathos saltator TaxID=610380 RepID=UPI000DBEEF82|nr:uncharacterized protein LOC109503619 [Harpegnathos saltator]